MYIGLDIGTTTLSAVVLDTDSGALLAHYNTPNVAGLLPGPGRTELDVAHLQRLAVDCLAGIVARAGIAPARAFVLADSVIRAALAIDAERMGDALQRGAPVHGVGSGCSRSACGKCAARK